MAEREPRGLVFNIQRYSVHDGPGIRTTVFLKGCPLRCLWCCNPESQSNREEVMYIKDHCTLCGTCVAVCPHHAPAIVDQDIRTDRGRCQGCGICCRACPNRARDIAGKYMTVKEVVTQVMEDSLFYRNSGGGVTLSGGEALMQPAFTAAILQACQESCVHTVLQTCGYTSETALFAVLPYVDLVLFDLKHMNFSKHQELTGVSNETILRNAKHISSNEIPIIVRVPVIKGANDSEENIIQLATFVKTIAQIQAVELLPYHNYALQKYAKLEREYPWNGEVPSEEHMERVRDMLAESGVNATVM